MGGLRLLVVATTDGLLQPPEEVSAGALALVAHQEVSESLG